MQPRAHRHDRADSGMSGWPGTSRCIGSKHQRPSLRCRCARSQPERGVGLAGREGLRRAQPSRPQRRRRRHAPGSAGRQRHAPAASSRPSRPSTQPTWRHWQPSRNDCRSSRSRYCCSRRRSTVRRREGARGKRSQNEAWSSDVIMHRRVPMSCLGMSGKQLSVQSLPDGPTQCEQNPACDVWRRVGRAMPPRGLTCAPAVLTGRRRNISVGSRVSG